MPEARDRFGSYRSFFLDERGAALRVSWHPGEAVAVLSLWREDRCTATFRATPADMAAIISCLSRSLAAGAEGRGVLSDSA